MAVRCLILANKSTKEKRALFPGSSEAMCGSSLFLPSLVFSDGKTCVVTDWVERWEIAALCRERPLSCLTLGEQRTFLQCQWCRVIAVWGCGYLAWGLGSPWLQFFTLAPRAVSDSLARSGLWVLAVVHWSLPCCLLALWIASLHSKLSLAAGKHPHIHMGNTHTHTHTYP